MRNVVRSTTGSIIMHALLKFSWALM